MSRSRFHATTAARFAGLALAGTILAALPAASLAASGQTTVTLTLKGHRFTPATFEAPAGQKVKITLINQDPAAEEFDSHDLRVEEVVTPMATISFTIGPLQPGQYNFMGEFHSETAQGHVIVH